MACQAYPALVKIAPVLKVSRTVSRRGLEVWRIDGDPAPLARDNILSIYSLIIPVCHHFHQAVAESGGIVAVLESTVSLLQLPSIVPESEINSRDLGWGMIVNIIGFENIKLRPAKWHCDLNEMNV